MVRRFFTQRRKLMRQLSTIGWIGLMLLFTAACHLEMYDQPKYKPLNSSDFFPNGSSARPLVENTVPRDRSLTTPLSTGRVDGTPDGAYLTDYPEGIAVNEALLARGQQRFEIYCSTCHNANGNGRGPVSGLFNPRPASLYEPRVVQLSNGEYFDVITHGRGAMYPYGSKIQDPADRWAIIAWIRELQKNPPAEGQ